MKIDSVQFNNRKSEFQVVLGKREVVFPFAKLRLKPTPDNPVVEAFPDDELGREAFTYRLASGEEDTIHIDAVLEVNLDPDYFRDLIMHQLTVEATKAIEESGLGKRQLARHLNTSPSQLYRLMDSNNKNKSLGQLLFLLHLANKHVEIKIHDRSPISKPIIG